VVGSEVHVIVMRPVPLLALMGLGGPLPLRVCRARVKGELAGGGQVQVDDAELARAYNREPCGATTLARAYCYIDRSAALSLAVGEYVGFLSGGFSKCVDLPDAQAAVRQRFAALIDGEDVPEHVLQSAREVGLVS